MLRRKEIILVICVVSFLIGFLTFYLPSEPPVPVLTDASKLMSSWAVVITYYGLLVGVVMIVKTAITSIYKQAQGVWPFYIIQLVTFLVIVGTGLLQGTQGELYITLAVGAYAPIAAASKSLSGLYGLTASYRAFRGRSLRTAIVMMLAIIVMLRLTLLGEFIPGIIDMSDWFAQNIQSSVYRAFTMAFSIGGVFYGIRLLLGRELRTFGIREDVEVEGL